MLDLIIWFDNRQAMKILNTKNSQQQRVKALIYGLSGAGKTSLAATLGESTFIISGEAGLLCLAGKNLDYFDLSLDEKQNVIKDPALRLKNLSDCFKWLHEGQKYKNIFVDGITEISELMVESLAAQFPDRKDSFPMWGEYSKRMRSVIKGFRDLPYNVFMTAVAEPDVDESKRRYMGFQVSGSIGKKMPQYFDEVFYLFSDADGRRSIITANSDTLICKDRSNRLNAQEPADLGHILGKIFQKEEK
jgi:hypothetical protein